VDKAKADKLKERAAELGMTVDEFLAAIASETGQSGLIPARSTSLIGALGTGRGRDRNCPQ
jgi:hypothetical protein